MQAAREETVREEDRVSAGATVGPTAAVQVAATAAAERMEAVVVGQGQVGMEDRSHHAGRSRRNRYRVRSRRTEPQDRRHRKFRHLPNAACQCNRSCIFQPRGY